MKVAEVCSFLEELNEVTKIIPSITYLFYFTNILLFFHLHAFYICKLQLDNVIHISCRF